jgi:hypothetical protein
MTNHRPINGQAHITTGDPDANWRLRAACRDHSDIFDAVIDAAGSKTAYEAAALAYCDRCPVKDQCFATALTRYHITHDVVGVWGGQIFGRRGQRRGSIGRPPQPITHGTYTGYQAHLRRRELACEARLEGHRNYRAGLADRNKEGDAA